MENLKFPELSKKIQQSIFGAWGNGNSDYSDDPYWHLGGELDEVVIGGGGSSGGDSGGSGWGDNNGGNDLGDGGPGDDYGGGGDSGSDFQQDQDLGWTWDEFLTYYEGADGEPVTLHQVGHFETIRNSVTFEALMDRVNDQIETALVSYIQANGITMNSSMDIGYDFLNSYDFTDDVFAIGSAIVSGVLDSVTVSFDSNGNISWDSSIYLTFHDVFEDPLDIWDVVPGTFDYSDPFIVNESWTEGLNGNILMYNQPNPRGDSDGSDGNRNMY